MTRCSVFGVRCSVFGVLLMLLLLPHCYAQAQGVGSTPVVSAQTTDPAQIKARLNKILSQPDFTTSAHAESEFSKQLHQFQDWFHSTWEKITNAFQKIIDWFRGKMRIVGVTGAFGTFILIAFLVACGAGMLYLLYRLFANNVESYRSRKRDREDQIQATDEELEEPTSRGTPQEWVTEANQFASKEDYRRAIRALFLAVLLELDQSGIQDFKRSLTNGDYLSLLHHHGFHKMADSFAPFVLTFEDRWYGEGQTSSADYEQCLNEYRRLSTLIESTASAGLSGSADILEGVGVAS